MPKTIALQNKDPFSDIINVMINNSKEWQKRYILANLHSARIL